MENEANGPKIKIKPLLPIVSGKKQTGNRSLRVRLVLFILVVFSLVILEGGTRDECRIQKQKFF